MTSDTDMTWKQTVHNRPARIDSVYTDTAKVWWLDNNTRGYVALDALGEVVGDE